ncbi:MAG: cyclic pyranopterin monophosphate synthase MoaC [Acidimicrobiia bacterium]|nr:cyclic pyranopterin monophosphate synthase MoaC [bacterium]MXX63481.1 cyclic pyranopterin monophosphate synthase MoaC [Acidimicrobiia bacterium]MCY3580709.1 cyclic pyranopterin monophosphate synthase MoaC [bacterium]MCY3652842.1 cyclic pyranopterin monophosphate synthase MoaC [bacterium]MXZ06189.1 cyclic pyranopterin monophosphate synthase MoaC [Acidimicrobiia bacterium]
MADEGRPHPRLTHTDDQGRARMVDVGGKPVTERKAIAEALVVMSAATLDLIFDGVLPKGDALGTARLAGIMGVKKTPELIPLCHPISVSGVTVDLERAETGVLVRTTVTTSDRTGVEMEALTGSAVASLTLYDMIKGVDRGARIEKIRLLHKSGGRSGEWAAG